MPYLGLDPLGGRPPPKPKEQSNPDPQLEVELEKLDPRLLQEPATPPTTPLDPDSPPARLKDAGYKLILSWSDALGDVLPLGAPFADTKCATSHCAITRDRSVLADADAVVIDAKDKAVPASRTSQQRWILFLKSLNEAKSANLTNIAFNWTWSYRRDSDIKKQPQYFQYVREQGDSKSVEGQRLMNSRLFEAWRHKKRMVMLLQDDCTINNSFVHAIKQKIDVDTFGKCGRPLCPNSSEQLDQCLKKLTKNYMFAISIESDECTSLLTDTFMKLLDTFIVPIALPSSNMSLQSPPNSVIKVQHFKTPLGLADYLNDVGTDFNKYKMYLDWKRKYRLINERNDLCKLCHLLHNDKTTPNQMYNNIQDWIEKDKC